MTFGKRFEFATAGRIVFGQGTAREVASAIPTFGKRALVVSGRRGCNLTSGPTFVVSGEPTIDVVNEGVALARRELCDMVVACGGGSVIDAGKAVSALLTNPGEVLDYLEVVGRGQPLQKTAAPCIAIPTTAGTGSEVTRNAVLASPEHKVKASLRSASMLPRLALVDPELTLDLPPALTASTGLDALTQLIEPYVSTRANALTDLYCVEGMRQVARCLRRAFADGSDLDARAGMSFASLMGGLALANAGLGAVHGFAAPIGGAFAAPHGAVCAALLPHVVAVNLRALRERALASDALARYETVARVLTGEAKASAEDVVPWVTTLCRELGIPRLRTYGVTDLDIPGLCAGAAAASSMKANPIPLTADELRQILSAAL